MAGVVRSRRLRRRVLRRGRAGAASSPRSARRRRAAAARLQVAAVGVERRRRPAAHFSCFQALADKHLVVRDSGTASSRVCGTTSAHTWAGARSSLPREGPSTAAYSAAAPAPGSGSELASSRSGHCF